MLPLRSEVDAGCLGTQSCKTIIQNIQLVDAVNEIGPLVSHVILSQSSKSHDFYDAHGGIYSVNVFLS